MKICLNKNQKIYSQRSQHPFPHPFQYLDLESRPRPAISIPPTPRPRPRPTHTCEPPSIEMDEFKKRKLQKPDQ